jgi:hypothetical protein
MMRNVRKTSFGMLATICGNAPTHHSRLGLRKRRFSDRRLFGWRHRRFLGRRFRFRRLPSPWYVRRGILLWRLLGGWFLDWRFLARCSRSYRSQEICSWPSEIDVHVNKMARNTSDV